MTLKQRIKERRKRSGYTRDEVIDKMGISVSKWTRWLSESEQYSSIVPDANELSSLAHLFNTTVAYLVGEIDDPSPTALSTLSSQTINAPSASIANVGEINGGENHIAGKVITESPAPRNVNANPPWWIDSIISAQRTVETNTPDEVDTALLAVMLIEDILRQGQALSVNRILKQAECRKIVASSNP